MKNEKYYMTPGRRGMRAVIGLFIFATAMLTFWACSRRDNTDYSQSLPETAITGALDSLFSTIFTPDGPGAIVIVMHDDTLLYRHAYGYADLEKGTRISDSTLFNLSSASKIFTSVALMKLVEEGKLNLDDSLSKYFPELPKRFFDKITIRHILTHSSGLPDLRPRNNDEWDAYLKSHKSVFGFGNDYRLYGSDNEHMQVFLNLDSVDFEPGTHYQHNDPGYILVAPLIERITGENFDSWMQRNMFDRAELKNVFYLTPGAPTMLTAHGYRIADPDTKRKTYQTDSDKWEEYDYGESEFFLTKADRGVYASAREFFKWKKALHNGVIISDSSLHAIGSQYVPTNIENVCYGLGTAVLCETGYPAKKYHSSANGGFAIAEGTWTDARLHYLVFSNRNDWDRRAVTAAIDSIFKAKGLLKKE